MLKLSYLDEINRRWRAEYGDMYETWWIGRKWNRYVNGTWYCCSWQILLRI
jgi:hypothetical protein